QTSTSALACIGTWLFFVVFFGLLASLVANALVPVGADATSLDMLRNQNLELALSRFSPTTLYHEAAGMLLIPQQRTLGPVMIEQLDRAIPGLLPFSQSLALVWPHFVGLLAATAAVFAISYIKFMRTEIRAA
ncbi:MAG: ABC transporter permease subunit, partial [Dethiobacteria bacterium]